MKGSAYWRIVLMASAILAGTSCRKDLCYDHDHSANINVKVGYNLDWYTHWQPGVSLDPDWEIDWSVVRPQEPEGVRLMTYPHYEQLSGQTYNMPRYGGKLNMSAGYHDLLFFNNDTEYILFGGKGNLTTATTRTRTRISYSKLYPEEITVNPPDMLFAAYFENLFIEDMDQLDAHTNLQKTLDVQLSPRVFSYIIRYEFESGLEYVSQSRGALTGMSGSVYLSNGHTANDPVTLLFDCVKTSWGCQTIIRSFGVPGITLHDTKLPDEAGDANPTPDVTRVDDYFWYNRDEGSKVIEVSKTYEHRLTLELYLINGKEKVIELDVTDQVNNQPRGGVIVVKGLKVTEDEGQESTGGGFDTEVDDWEDDKIVDIPID